MAEIPTLKTDPIPGLRPTMTFLTRFTEEIDQELHTALPERHARVDRVMVGTLPNEYVNITVIVTADGHDERITYETVLHPDHVHRFDWRWPEVMVDSMVRGIVRAVVLKCQESTDAPYAYV